MAIVTSHSKGTVEAMASSVDEEEIKEAISYYPYLLLAVSCAGVFSNVASLFVFARQRFRKMFHQLLVLLALYDFMVSTFRFRYGFLGTVLQFL